LTFGQENTSSVVVTTPVVLFRLFLASCCDVSLAICVGLLAAMYISNELRWTQRLSTQPRCLHPERRRWCSARRNPRRRPLRCRHQRRWCLGAGTAEHAAVGLCCWHGCRRRARAPGRRTHAVVRRARA